MASPFGGEVRQHLLDGGLERQLARDDLLQDGDDREGLGHAADAAVVVNRRLRATLHRFAVGLRVEAAAALLHGGVPGLGALAGQVLLP